MKQTPMMMLLDWIDEQDKLYVHDIITKATELRAEEREAIKYAHTAGQSEWDSNPSDMDAEHYYTQTYGGGDE